MDRHLVYHPFMHTPIPPDSFQFLLVFLSTSFNSVLSHLPATNLASSHLRASNLTIGDWQQALKGTKDAPILIDDNIRDIIEVKDDNNSLLYTAQEVAKGIKIKVKDKNDITTNLGVSSNEAFDPNS
jgi:hypothetical protein